MRVRVLKEFRDKEDYSRVYKEGSVVSFDEERAQYLIELGLVENPKESDSGRSTKSNSKGDSSL